MTDHRASQLFVIALAVSLVGFARGDGCCPNGKRIDPITGQASFFGCSVQIAAADCSQDGQSGYIQGGICVANVCTSGGVATAGSDPVLTGFDNATFEFFGHPGSDYSVITSETFTVNMGLVEAGPRHIRHQQGEGTFIGSFAVLLPSFELIAHASEAGDMTFSLNGAEIDNAKPTANDLFTYEPYFPSVGQVITVTHAPFRFTIIAVKQYTDDISGYNRGHLDLSVELTGPVVSTVTGALGQTLYGHIKAQDETFLIPSLTHHKSLSEDVISTSRRLMAFMGPEGQLAMGYPMHAKLTSGPRMSA